MEERSSWTPPGPGPDWGDTDAAQQRSFLKLTQAVLEQAGHRMNPAGYFECALCHVEIPLPHLDGCPVARIQQVLAESLPHDEQRGDD